jgi:hypothetical protein
MIASPGDVAQERRIARDIVHEWNAINSAERGTVLLPLAWETNASPALGDRAQAIIDDQLVKSADLLVAVFWTRLGTPTGSASSGTVEEIQEHVKSGKPVMLYFSSAPVQPESVDAEQYKALREFRASIQKRGLVESYESISEFREKFTRQLAQTIIQRFPASSGGATPTGVTLVATGTVRDPGVSEDGRRLLKQAAADPNGVVLMLRTFGGLSIESNGESFVERGNPRSEATWQESVRELVQKKLLEQRDQRGEVYAVTALGFRVADKA